MGLLKQLKRRANQFSVRVALPEVFTVSKIGKIAPLIRNPTDAKGHVAIVGTKTYGLNETGKVRPRLFFPKFHRSLVEEHNVACFYYQTCGDLLNNIQRHKAHKLVVVLVYGEDKDPPIFPSSRLVQEIQEKHPSCQLVNHPSSGQVIRDKVKSNILLTEAGVPMPRMDAGDTSGIIFSNSRFGTKEESYLTERAGSDKGRYNTEFIDTKYTIDDVEYYCSLRALAVGGVLLDLWPRFRPISDGCANVHSQDTPQNAYLLNKFYAELAMPLRPRAEEICAKIKEALGLGFYACDILFNHNTDRMVVCEVGYKFADHAWVSHCGDLYTEVPWLRRHRNYEIAMHSAAALVHEAFD